MLTSIRPVQVIALITIAMVVLSIIARAELIIREPHRQQRFSIENQNLFESSGLACSTRDSALLWSHNDSGHMPIIYAMDKEGRDRGTFHLDDIENIDWEDMDAFQYQGEHYLLIADTGDNLKLRLSHRISIIREPKLGMASRSAISPAWSIFYQYEDGHNYNVESVAVDVAREKIILLSKQTNPTLVFELPLKPANDDEIQQAVKIAEFSEVTNPSALDISADGRWLSVNTYRRIHRYRRAEPGQPWQYEYSLKYKPMFQPEAMCLNQAMNHYFVTSEKKVSLLRISINGLDK